jgi:hypothetical protein
LEHTALKAPSFKDDLDSLCQRIRGAMTDLLTEAGGEPEAPAALSRHLQVSRTLAWRVSKIATATKPLAVLEFLPRHGSIEILLSACQRAGAGERAVERIRTAVAALDELVATHAGDRETLDMMLADDGDTSTTAIMESRRQAFLGNSGIWGIRCRTRFSLTALGPNHAGDGLMDLAMLAGVVGVRRLRTDVSVPLHVRFGYNDDGSERTESQVDSLSGDWVTEDRVPLVREFSVGGDGELLATPDPTGGIRYELAPGPVGNTAQTTWVFGWRESAFASMYADETNHFGEHGVRNLIPAESLQADLLVHRSLPIARNAETMLISGLGGERLGQFAGVRFDYLPMPERLQSIGHEPPVVSSTVVPRYPDMVDLLMQRMKWDINQFVGYRLVMKYPPIPTVAMIRYPLVSRG